MSDVQSKSDKKKVEVIDPTIDITSEHFDPLKALYSVDVVIPYKKAKIYDNISKYETEMKKQQKRNESASTSTLADTQTNSRVTRSQLSDSNEPIVRRFLPHQGLVQGHHKKKHSRNILAKIEKGFGGPVDLLKTYLLERKRIMIYTRKEHGILGYITGFVESFDKHWNIVLSDVCEVWKRKKIHFCDVADFGQSEDCSSKLHKMNVQFPKVTVKSLNRKYVECTRRVPQLMIRGEQVAVITIDPTLN